VYATGVIVRVLRGFTARFTEGGSQRFIAHASVRNANNTDTDLPDIRFSRKSCESHPPSTALGSSRSRSRRKREKRVTSNPRPPAELPPFRPPARPPPPPTASAASPRNVQTTRTNKDARHLAVVVYDLPTKPQSSRGSSASSVNGSSSAESSSPEVFREDIPREAKAQRDSPRRSTLSA